MTKKYLLIQSTDYYNRIALINEFDQIEEYNEEYKNLNTNKQGNIYEGFITSIEPKLNAVFVNYGEKKYGFLNFISISPEYLNCPNKEEILSKLKHSFGDSLKNCDLYKNLPIEKFLYIGQKLTVQIIREEKAEKGVMLSTFISLQGKSIKIILNSINNNIICNNKEIKKMIQNFCQEHSMFGTIICFLEENWQNILLDLQYFLNIYKKIKNHSEENLIYSTNDIFLNFFIFNLGDNINYVNKIFLDGNNSKIKSIFSNIPIVEKHNVFLNFEKQVDQIFSNIVQLPSGGYCIFDYTSIGTTIDVNLGKSKNLKNYEESILETNLEAISAICLQIKLRNLGGLIIIDLIDMENLENTLKIQKYFEKCIESDFVKINFSPINSFNVLMLSRQYRFTNLVQNHYTKCENCQGGMIKKIEITVEKIFQKISYLIKKNSLIELHLSSQLGEHIFNNYKDIIFSLEKKNEIKFTFIIVEKENPNYYEIFNY